MNFTLALTAGLFVNSIFLAYKVLAGIAMLDSSSATQKCIALSTPSTYICTIFSSAAHTAARWMGLQDAAPPCCLKNAVVSLLFYGMNG